MAELLTCRSIPLTQWRDVTTRFVDLGIEQTATYGQAAAARIGARTVCLVVEQADHIVAAAQLRVKTIPGLRRGIAWGPGAPLLLQANAAAPPLAGVLAALREHVTKQGHILRLRLPVLGPHAEAAVVEAARAAGFATTDRAGSFRTVLVDLSDGEEALLARLHGKWRNPLRNTWKAGLEVETGGFVELYPRFRALYDEVRDAKGFTPDIPPEFYRTLNGEDFHHMTIIATRENRDLGAVTVGLTGQGAIYLFGATGAEGRKVGAGYFLTWEGYRLARAMGAKTYDLGGIDPDANPTVTRFKQRAGGQEAAQIPWEARPAGPVPHVILMAETLRKRLKR
jgi:hypothetical protein